MAKPFVILFFSDTHFGNPKTHSDDSGVLDSFVTDIKNFVNHNKIIPNIVIFAGDLVFGEVPSKTKIGDQYESIAIPWLKKLYKSCFKKTFDQVPLFIVPGNHDLNRTIIDDTQKDYIRNLKTKLNYYDHIYEKMNNNDIAFQRIIERQKAWHNEFIKIPNKKCDIEKKFNSCSGIIKYDNLSIGITGLNSAWAAHDDNDKDFLWIGKAQYEHCYEKIKKTDFKIAFSHHPLDWLVEDDKVFLRNKIQTQYDIFLHGHDHDSWIQDMQNHLIVASGATYQGSKKENSYSWIMIDFKNKNAKVYLREHKKKGSDIWGPLQIGSISNESGIAEIKGLFPIVKKKKIEKGRKSALIATRINTPTNVAEFINVLHSDFGCVWEPTDNPIDVKNTNIYWPVRLRVPGPIHAFQSFVAAGLQKYGANITLFIDELGNQNYQIENFKTKMKHWFESAGGNPGKLQIKCFSEVIDKMDDDAFFKILREWIGSSEKRLREVLKVSKLWPRIENEPNSLSKLGERRPRRILTPPLVWACLNYYSKLKPKGSIITLGGYDERELWHAWKETINAKGLNVGHLYIQQLSKFSSRGNKNSDPLHMDDPNIAWSSKSDIEELIQREIKLKNWHLKNKFIPWSIIGIVFLPSYLSGKEHKLLINGKRLKKIDELKKLNKKTDFIISLKSELTKWLVN
jgi:DNA repair exonuclease SbcCD nuclease subunit